MLELLERLLGVKCEGEEAVKRPFAARLCVLEVFSRAIYERGPCLSYKEILGSYKRGSKGHLSRVIRHLMDAGLIERRGDMFCITSRAIMLLSPDPPCPELFLAGSDTALRVAAESGVRPLNWLLSAGRYWRNGGFRGYEEDLGLARGLGGLLFLDSGAQQFYKKFRGYNYPYTAREYLGFAAQLGVDLIATLDLPLDILVPRGLGVGEGVRRTVELGVEVVSEAEKRGLLHRVVPVLQGYDDPSQWLECLDLYRQHGVAPQNFRLWGVGSLCMARSVRLTEAVLAEVRRALGGGASVHVFGLSVGHLRAVYSLVDSYDTSAWVYWAKVDGAALVWSPRRGAFVHLQARDGRRYDTEVLMDINLRQVVAMHEWLCRAYTGHRAYRITTSRQLGRGI